MALDDLFCADVPLRNYSLTHSLTLVRIRPLGLYHCDNFVIIIVYFEIIVSGVVAGGGQVRPLNFSLSEKNFVEKFSSKNAKLAAVNLPFLGPFLE